MHRTRIYGFFIDTPLDHADAAVAFWSAALGTTTHRDPPDDPYWRLVDAASGIQLEVQAVDDTPRYHMDIETDDVSAEVDRLRELGATVVTDTGGWTVLRAPGGHLFCVVPVQSGEEVFQATSTVWP
jgi:catechol 2,3-dioxygenase-like lactoylglutathione lyase family enzyme